MIENNNYLALDIGTKRIGVAVGSVVPFGRGIIDASNTREALFEINRLIEIEGITHIIIGVPKVKSGEITSSHKNALVWIDRLKETFSQPVETVDEAYSSVAAEHQLLDEKVDVKTEKWRIDERAAELILGQYLDESK